MMRGLTSHERFMQRCLDLARQGEGYTAPNPMVGAVLVYEGRIIGEGFHREYGGPHAEVNCISSVKPEDRSLIPQSTLYVSLEPCAHFGKTPPCADLIVRERIPKCVIAMRDPFHDVNGKGIERLKASGVEVLTGVLAKQAEDLNRRFFLFHTKHRPYLILKWAQTADGLISAAAGERLFISNEISNRLVHRWRSEESAILVGTRTALLDDPELTNRHWPGPSPVRMVVDVDLSLPRQLKLFNGKVRTIVFNLFRHDDSANPVYYQVSHDTSLVHQIVNASYQMQMLSLIVEGGARLLQSFIDSGYWDEARIITNRQLFAGSAASGLPAPVLSHAKKTQEFQLAGDTVEFFRNDQ